MLDFSITFIDQSNFQFIDNSNASDYSGLSTLKTRLEVIYPVISENVSIEVNLFDENISTLTDNHIIDIEVETQLGSLVDGAYQVDLVLYDDSGATNEVGRVTKYFVQDYSIQQCIKLQVEAALCECPDSWCDISKLRAIAESAHWSASQDQWSNAQNMINFLTKECNKLNCSC